MAAVTLDGAALARRMREDLHPQVAAFTAKAGRAPGLALVLVCVGVFAALWLNDPAHRPADTWRPGQHPELPTITPTPYPTLIGNAWLTNEPGQEMETDWNRAARACRAEDGEALYIVQTVTRRGIRYHLAEAYPGCKGWLPDYLIRR